MSPAERIGSSSTPCGFQEQTNTPSSDSSSDEGDEDRGVRHNRDGTLASGTKEELRLAQRLAKDPWGRFGGRAGKLERIRRQEAAMATAKLGMHCRCMLEQRGRDHLDATV